MKKDYQGLLNQLNIVLDILVTIFSYIVAYAIRFYYMEVQPGYPAREYFVFLIPIVLFYLVLYAAFQLYQPKRVMGRRLEAGRVLYANGMGLMVLILVLYLFKFVHFSRTMLMLFAVINTCLMTAERIVVRMILRSLRKKGFNQKQVLLVGYSRAAEGFIDRAKANPQWGYQVRGILDDTYDWGMEYKGVKVIGKLSELEGILELNRLDEVLITLSLEEYQKLQHLVYLCEKSGVHTKFIPDYNNIIPTKPYTEDLLGLPVVHIRHVPLTGLLNKTIKRTMDIVGSLICIVIFSPVMLVTAIAVKLSSPGPIIFKQERVGLHNRPFRMYKFRSMGVAPASEEKSKWTTKNDARVTGVGKFIRKTSIDELPQLFNVLIGNMSLVGPRPERPFFVEKFREEIPRYMIKHQVRPGMTGWAQVNGLRGDTSIRKRIDYDLYYIENWTVGFDIKILFLTVFRGFVNKNAY